MHNSGSADEKTKARASRRRWPAKCTRLFSSRLHPETTRSEWLLWRRRRASCRGHIKEYDYCLIVFSKFSFQQSITSRELGWRGKRFRGKMRNKWCLAGCSPLCCGAAAPAPIFNWFSVLQSNPQARKPVLGPHMWALSVCVMLWLIKAFQLFNFFLSALMCCMQQPPQSELVLGFVVQFDS